MESHVLKSLNFMSNLFIKNETIVLNNFLTFNKYATLEAENNRIFSFGQSDFCDSNEEIKNFKIQKKLESFKNTKNQVIINLFLPKNTFDYFLYAYNPDNPSEERIYIRIDQEDEEFLKTRLIKELKFSEEIFNLNLTGILFYSRGKIVACFDYNKKTSEIVKKFNKENYPNINDEEFLKELSISTILIDRSSRVKIFTTKEVVGSDK